MSEAASSACRRRRSAAASSRDRSLRQFRRRTPRLDDMAAEVEPEALAAVRAGLARFREDLRRRIENMARGALMPEDVPGEGLSVSLSELAALRGVTRQSISEHLKRLEAEDAIVEDYRRRAAEALELMGGAAI